MFKHTAPNQAWRRLLGAAFFVFVVTCPVPIANAASPSAAPDVLTLSEAADVLRVGADELEQLASRNEVPARRIGSGWRFNRDALLAWVNGDWGRIATIGPPDAGARQPLAGAQDTPAMAGLSLTPRELERTTGAGTVVAQAPPTQTESSPPNSGEMTIGEAPEERTAEDVFLRGQKVLLARGEVAVDVGQFYSRGDNTQLAVVGNGVGLATIRQSTFTTLLSARVGIFDETEAFVSAIFRSQSSDVFAGGGKIAEDHRTEFGDIRLGLRRTFLTEGPGRPNIIGTLFGHVPTGQTSYAIGGGLSLVKSFDPVVLFATANYRHTFSRDYLDVTRLEPEERFDVTLGYALALNDTLTISTSVSGLFSGATTFTNATLLRQDIYSLQLGLTSWLARGLYIEPTVSFGLSGPGNSVAFGVTLPYTF
jgi:excisionase family DNA binding protein